MADEIAEVEAPHDFAAMAERITKTEASEVDQIPAPRKPEPKLEAKKEPEPKVEKPASDRKAIPDELFGGKREGKKTEATGDESDFDKIEDPQFKDPKRKADWETLKTKGREYEKQAKENAKKAIDLETKIKDYEAKGKDTETLQAKLTELEKQNGEYLALVRKVNIELDPAFRSQFIEGRTKLIKNAKTIIEESGGDASAVETALNLTGKPRVDALKEIAGDLDGFQQGRLGRVIDALTALDEEAASKRGNPEEYLNNRQREEQERVQNEQQTRARNANLAFDKVEHTLSSELEVLRNVDGLEWWNEQAKQIKTAARQKFNSPLAAEEAASIYINAEATRVYRDLFLAEREEHASDKKKIAEMEAELKGIYSKGPKIDGSAATKAGGFRDFATRTEDAMQGR